MAMETNFKDKKALVRVDFNVPLDKEYNITDDNRIQAALPTINHILKNGGAVILMSHLGRPLKKLNEDGSINVEKFTLRHVVNHVQKLVGVEVLFATDTVGADAQSKAAALKMGQVLIIENTRFHKEEEKGDETFAKGLAALADVYVNDAFGTAHRAHASTTTVAHYFTPENKCFGFLMQAELDNANILMNAPKRPFTAITGGAKVSDKILLLEKLLDKVDNLIIGGGMAYTFSKAQGGNIGKSICELDKLDLALDLLKKAEEKGVKIYLPIDNVIADDFSPTANTQIVSKGQIPDGWEGLDAGPETIKLFSSVVKSSKTILWNGPLGVFEFEKFAVGTKAMAEAVAEATQEGAYSLIGGGDSVAAVIQMGLGEKVSYASTGGGAMLELLEGKVLPGVAAMTA